MFQRSMNESFLPQMLALGFDLTSCSSDEIARYNCVFASIEQIKLNQEYSLSVGPPHFYKYYKMIVEQKNIFIGWGIKQFKFRPLLFKTPKFQVHQVHHESLGKFICLVYSQKQTQTHVYSQQVRKDDEPVYIFRDSANQYAIYYKFQILGMVVEKRMKEFNKALNKSNEWQTLSINQTFAEYEKNYHENQFSFLSGPELESALFSYFSKNHAYAEFTGYSDFNINMFAKRYHFVFMYGHFPIKSNQRQLLFTRKANLLRIAQKIFRNIDHDFAVQLNEKGDVVCNRTQMQIIKQLKSKMSQKNLPKIIVIENFASWLSIKVAFMLYKISTAKQNSDYLKNQLWRQFFVSWKFQISTGDKYSDHQKIIQQGVRLDVTPQNASYFAYRKRVFVNAKKYPRRQEETEQMEEEERNCRVTDGYKQEFIRFHELMGIKYLPNPVF